MRTQKTSKLLAAGVGAMNLQDLKMGDQKRTKTEKCRTWKMTDTVTSKLANKDTVTGYSSHVELNFLQNYKQLYRPRFKCH